MNAPTPSENPMGLDGFEFVEFTGPDPDALAGLFTAMGFTHLGNHRSKHVRHYAQGDMNFILNMEPAGQAAEFRSAHGPSANGMAFRVKDSKQAFALALERGALTMGQVTNCHRFLLLSATASATDTHGTYKAVSVGRSKQLGLFTLRPMP